MSARVVAVTRLLLDVLQDLDRRDELSPAEVALVDLLVQHTAELTLIEFLAVKEMQALAPMVLAT